MICAKCHRGWTCPPEIAESDVRAEDLDICTACTDGIACDDGQTPAACDRNCDAEMCARARIRQRECDDDHASELADARCKQLTLGE